MKKQLLIIGIILTLLTIGLSGCEEQKRTDDTSKFIGIWKLERSSENAEMVWIFYNNGSLKWVPSLSYYQTPIIVFMDNITNHALHVQSVTYRNVNSIYPTASWFDYKIKDGQLNQSFPGAYGGGLEYMYTFSDDNHISLSPNIYPGELQQLTRTDESALNQSIPTGPIEWKNINITINVSDIIHWDWVKLTRSDIPYSGDHAPDQWGNVTVGDELQFGDYRTFSVTLRWIPTKAPLSSSPWYF